MPNPANIRDTSLEAEAVLIRLLRAKPAWERLGDAISASNRVAEQCKNAIQRQHPKISKEEIELRFIKLNYGSEVAAEVRAHLSDRDER